MSHNRLYVATTTNIPYAAIRIIHINMTAKTRTQSNNTDTTATGIHGSRQEATSVTELAPPTWRSQNANDLVAIFASTNLIDEFHCLLALDTANGADLRVIEEHTVELVGDNEHLWPESGRDKLCRRCEGVDHV